MCLTCEQPNPVAPLPLGDSHGLCLFSICRLSDWLIMKTENSLHSSFF